MTRRRYLGGLLGPALAVAQENVFRVEVKLVRLLVTVKDETGAAVGSLPREEFSVRDSGVTQHLALFEPHTDKPLSIALLVDTSASTAKDLKYEIESAGRFLRALVKEGHPKDALRLYNFNHDVTSQTGFIRNPGRIERALANLRAGAGTSLYDALWFAARALEDRDGRRVIVAVTDGGDTTSAKTYHDALRAAHQSDVVIYSIVVVPIPNDAGRNVAGEHALITLGRSTGGRVFFPTVGPALDAAFSEILRDLRTQYLLGYYPKDLPPSQEKFRTVEVSLRRPDLRAFTRGGYYGE